MFSVIALSALSLASATVFFQEDFSDGDAWRSRWVESTHKGEEAGDWKLSAGKFFGDAEADKGIQTAQDARFYQLSALFPKEFSNKGKKLIVQYVVKNEQGIDCGGGYIKLLPAGVDQQDFNGDSPYSIMFGPDQCGSTKRVHVIFNYDGKNHLLDKEISLGDASGVDANLFTLIVNPDQTYEVKINNESKQTGDLEEDWSMLPSKEIDDPKATKPEDWDDRAQIDDPEDVKPAGWDDIPAEIADPEATKPDDWDDELDGDWEAPLIPNPEYKGEWHPKKIDNPKYSGGPWTPPKVANPDYDAGKKSELGVYNNLAGVGIEIWQVKSGTIFDDILVTDDESAASAAADKFLERRTKQVAAREEKEEAERKEAEAAAEAAAAAGGDDEDEDAMVDDAEEVDLQDEL